METSHRPTHDGPTGAGSDATVFEFPSRRVSRGPVGPTTTEDQPGAGQRDPLWRELAGQVLRSERIDRKRTLQQVAERAGVSPQYLSEVERGRKDPSSEMLESICGALGLRLTDLLTLSGRLLVTTSVPLSIPRSRPTGYLLLAA